MPSLHKGLHGFPQGSEGSFQLTTHKRWGILYHTTRRKLILPTTWISLEANSYLRALLDPKGRTQLSHACTLDLEKLWKNNCFKLFSLWQHFYAAIENQYKCILCAGTLLDIIDLVVSEMGILSSRMMKSNREDRCNKICHHGCPNGGKKGM